MNEMATAKKMQGAPVRKRNERLATAQRVFGTWKRPLKRSLRTLAAIRRGLDRDFRRVPELLVKTI